MTIKHIVAAASILFVGTLAIPVASAIDKGGYLGISSGGTEADISVSDFDDGNITSGSVDDSNTGLKLFGGFQITDSFAVEGGVIDFGEATFDGTSDGSVPLEFAAGPVSVDIETQGLFFNFVGMKSFTRLSIFGKLGVLVWRADGEVVDSSGSFDLDEWDFEENGESAMAGVGIEFRPTKKIAIRSEWEQYQGALVDERDIDLLAVSILIRR